MGIFNQEPVSDGQGGAVTPQPQGVESSQRVPDQELAGQAKALVDEMLARNVAMEGHLLTGVKMDSGSPPVYIFNAQRTDNGDLDGAGVHSELGPVLLNARLARLATIPEWKGKSLQQIARETLKAGPHNGVAKLVGVQDEQQLTAWTDILNRSATIANAKMAMKPSTPTFTVKALEAVRGIQ